ncbi:MAG: DUF1343 domain-containing protein [Mariniblastus sp.]|nr:DUF1343 domain-containing protein [Mariniblastus sp.]
MKLPMVNMPNLVSGKIGLTQLLCLTLFSSSWAWAVGQSVEDLLSTRSAEAEIEALIVQGISEHRLPGCVVIAGNGREIFYHRAFGCRQIQPTRKSMEKNTLFDLASLTKPLATSACVMKLWEQGELKLSDPVAKYLPEFQGNGKSKITIRQLLTHQGGLIPDNHLREYDGGVERAFEKINALKLVAQPGSTFIYSDVGFIVLAKLVEKVSGCKLDKYCQTELWSKLDMTETGFSPEPSLRKRAAATEPRKGVWMNGVVHDPRAFRLNGVAGHAGLFSTAEDLAIYAQMWLGRGALDGQQIFASETVDVMTQAYQVSRGIRGLGWDKQTGYSTNRAEGMSASAYGHGGFTGTAIWIDPEQDLFYVFLSNRVHPDGKGSVNRLIGKIGQILVEKNAAENQTLGNRNERLTGVRTGLDCLIQQAFQPLYGKRIGLITNQTGRTHDGNWNVDALGQSEHVDLVRLFSPEHGIEGLLDQPLIGDSRMEERAMDVVSLYGEVRRPTAKQLEDIDCLVFDIQDVGTRFYTYISTLQYALKAAAEQGIRFVVLDRPNPVGGHKVQGPVLEPELVSFVGCHPLPICHGMTVGELARMFATDLQIDVDLCVIPVENWKRGQYFDETGLAWVNPSPNIRNLNQAILYPGVGLLEYTNVSVGRGTEAPFEIVGAPWVDRFQLADRLNRAKIEGVRFMPLSFTPQSSKHAGDLCHGVSIRITDREKVSPVRLGFEMAMAFRDDYAASWQSESFGLLLGSERLLEAFMNGALWPQLQEVYLPRLNEFKRRREPFLIYK